MVLRRKPNKPTKPLKHSSLKIKLKLPYMKRQRASLIVESTSKMASADREATIAEFLSLGLSREDIENELGAWQNFGNIKAANPDFEAHRKQECSSEAAAMTIRRKNAQSPAGAPPRWSEDDTASDQSNTPGLSLSPDGKVIDFDPKKLQEQYDAWNKPVQSIEWDDLNQVDRGEWGRTNGVKNSAVQLLRDIGCMPEAINKDGPGKIYTVEI